MNAVKRRWAAPPHAVLDTTVSMELNRIVRLAARIFDTPMALIALSRADQPALKASFRPEGDKLVPAGSFCATDIYTDEVVEVVDPASDPRFADQPEIRYYCGAPLVTKSGGSFGMLCVVDRKTRPSMGPSKLKLLQQLAALTVQELAPGSAEVDSYGVIDLLPYFNCTL